MRALAVASSVARFGPRGAVEVLLASVFIASWFFPAVLGAGIPATLRFILVAEGGYVLIRVMIAAPMEQDASRLEAALWVLLVSGGVGALLSRDGGVVGALVFFLHLAVDFPMLEHQMNQRRRDRVSWALLPVSAVSAGILMTMLGALPELGWTRWAIPEGFWLVLESGEVYPQAIPAVGSVYFFVLSAAALGRPLSEIEKSRSSAL